MSNKGFWIPPDRSEMTSNDYKNNDAHQVEVSQIQILGYYRHFDVWAGPNWRTPRSLIMRPESLQLTANL